MEPNSLLDWLAFFVFIGLIVNPPKRRSIGALGVDIGKEVVEKLLRFCFAQFLWGGGIDTSETTEHIWAEFPARACFAQAWHKKIFHESGERMKRLRKPLWEEKHSKNILVAVLYIGSALILGSGLWFSGYSLLHNVSFAVLNTTVPGVVLAVLVTYFGFRSLLSIRRLSDEIRKDSAYFSWDNFKWQKLRKAK